MPHESQQTYKVLFRPGINARKILDDMGVSDEDFDNALAYIYYGEESHYRLPLTEEMAKQLAARPEVEEVLPDVRERGSRGLELFPHAEGYDWSEDNFGPVHIPAKGETLQLTLENLPLYQRVIEVYEGNSLEVRDGKIFINGEQTNRYTCKMDYYWMMGDNRHNSADSRFWGFVPEDHISGKGSLVVFSWDKDHHRVRWNRLFKRASAL
jgi:signal peptidase I